MAHTLLRRQKNQKKLEALTKAGSQLKARQEGLKFICPVCRTQLANAGVLRTHMEAKHPGAPIPDS